MINTIDHIEAKSDRISNSNRSSTRNISYYDDFYCHMLIEDLSNGIAPFSSREEHIINCRLNPESEILENEIKTSLPTNYHSSRTLSEAVMDFVDYVGNILAHNGICIYEIVSSTDSIFKDYFGSRWVLVDLYYEDIWIVHKWIIQYIRNESKKKNNNIPLLFIPKSKCVIFEFPKRLVGRRGYKRLLKSLSYTNQIEDSTKMINKYRQDIPNYYDFISHQKKLEILRWKITNILGWHDRSYYASQTQITEYFLCERILNFRKSQIIIRDHIIEIIKDMIKRIGKKFGQDVTLEIEVPINIIDLENALLRLQKGEFEFDEIGKFLR